MPVKRTLSDLLDEEIYPALYAKLDQAFPEFGWKRTERAWTASRWPEDFPFLVEHPHPDRLVVYDDGPAFIMIHGHAGMSWIQYLSGGETPRGAAFREVLKQLAAKAGVTMPGRKLDPEEIELQRYFDERRRCLGLAIKMGQRVLFETAEGKYAIDYLLDRGFTEEDMQVLGLGYYRAAQDFEAMFRGEGCDLDVARKAGLVWPQLEGYILVPWMDAVGGPLTLYGRYQQRNPPEGRPKTIAMPGAGTKSSPLYYDRARRAGHRDLIAVEGVFDAALLQVRGDSRVIAYVGAQFTHGQVQTLSRYGATSVTIVPDPDRGGDRGAVASVEMLERAGIRAYVAPRLPDGKDPDEFVLSDGVEAWRALVGRAIPGPVHKATVLLQVSIDSSETDRRSSVEKVAAYAASLKGTWAEEDREQIVKRTAAATGFADNMLTALFAVANPHAITEEPKAEEGEIAVAHFTDLGNAQRLAHRHGRDMRHVDGLGWLVWDGVRWIRDTTGEVERCAKETVRAMYQQAAEIADDDERRALVAHARRSESAFRISAMISLARSEREVVARAAELDAAPFSLNVINGTIDLRTGDLRPHRREDLITKLAPVEYHPEATSPRFTAFLEEIFARNRELIGFMQRASGYALTGDVREQVFFYLYGTGANGKSTLLLLLMHVLGDYAKQAAPNLLVARRTEEHPTSVADLRGARLVVTNEIESGRALAESLVKQITGGDKIKGRFMRQDFFEFDATHKIWLAANHKLVVKGTDLGIWRRIRLVPFTVTILEEHRDKDLLEKLRAEAPGILAWAVRGCLEWQRRGMGAPKEVIAATEQYRSEMDALAQFIDECCIVGENFKVAASGLYRAYVEWCEKAGEHPASQRVFGERLTERGFAPGKGTAGIRVRLGLRLNEVAGGAVGGGCSRMTPNIFHKKGKNLQRGPLSPLPPSSPLLRRFRRK